MPDSRERRIVEGISSVWSTGKLHGEGWIQNLSREGLFVRSERLPEPGDPIALVCYFEREKLELRGEVRWTSPVAGGTGLPRGFGVHLPLPGRAFLELYRRLLEPQ
ncbi:MAG TPA: PilZ domain-containing protein [Myxococcota bacterium]|nr:PilZ domain-containing protein [Myxococcota bacterium]